MRIEDEIQQKQFENAYQKVSVNILFSSSWLTTRHHQILKPFDITIQQFNILRILRGMRCKPATIKGLTDKMIDKMSNASRLVEKLKKKGLVERSACECDRRRVDVRISEKGLQVIARASAALEADLQNTFNLTLEEAETLSNLLDKMRG